MSVYTPRARELLALAVCGRKDQSRWIMVMVLHGIVVRMADQDRWETLGRIAESQAGYVTTAQAEQAGFHRNGLGHHTREGGRLERAGRGLYRLRFYPSSPHEQIAAAWVLAGPGIAVVSHESALELYGLSDVSPSAVHLTLPRRYRHRKAPIGTRFHYPRELLTASEIRRVQGLPSTSPERTILDVLEAGTQPEQVELAVRQAIERALTTPKRLRSAAAMRAATVQAAIERLLQE